MSRCDPQERMHAGDHACLIYTGEDELRSALVPWVVSGLAGGERCLLVLNAETREARLDWLREAGVDLQAERQRRALVVADMREVYLDRGLFQPERVIHALRNSVIQARAAGFSGLRAAGELDWAARTIPGADRLEEYERAINQAVQEWGARIMCLYDASALPPHRLSTAYRTHPYAMVHRKMRRSALCAPGGATMRGADRSA